METKENYKLINGTKRFFIHIDGYVFKTDNGKDYIIELKMIRGVPKVQVQNQKLNLVLLMLEYFGDKLNHLYDKYTYKIVDGKIPFSKIKTVSISETESEDDKIIFRYKCNEKANSQNNRVKKSSTISAIDVLNSLKRTNFKCTYCGLNLKPLKWHLDHFNPLSLKGLNQANNITPSCKDCNLMKGYIPFDRFLRQIKLIHNNYINN